VNEKGRMRGLFVVFGFLVTGNWLPATAIPRADGVVHPTCVGCDGDVELVDRRARASRGRRAGRGLDRRIERVRDLVLDVFEVQLRGAIAGPRQRILQVRVERLERFIEFLL
jgi:hypothetical protein